MAKGGSVEVPANIGIPRLGWGSDVVAEMLRRLGIEYISLNPGASFRGLHDSIVNYLGNHSPKMIMTLHEEHAIAIAHGYAKVKGRPMAACVHANVGLMHAAMGIFNAWCDRVPVLVLGATGPVDAAKRRPWVDWVHTTPDQASIVRNYTKWDDLPASPEASVEAMLRAAQIALTQPEGPVYVCLDKTVQETPVGDDFPLPDPKRYEAGADPAPDAAAVTEAAGLLAAAKAPLVLVGRVGFSQASWDRRVALVEKIGARTLSSFIWGGGFPSAHPSRAAAPFYFPGREAADTIRAADVILSLDWPDLAGTLGFVFKTRNFPSKIIHISLDRLTHTGWTGDSFGLPAVDIPILATPERGVAALLDVLPPHSSADWPVLPHSTPELPANAAGRTGISHRDLAECFNRLTAGSARTMARLPVGWPADELVLEDSLSFLGIDGGLGVGSGPGIAIGAALALKGNGRLTVAVIGDGDFLMGSSALWTAAKYEIPLLLIVANNRSYYNDEEHQEHLAIARNRPPENKWIGQQLDDPAPDLAAIARGHCVSAAFVDTLADLPDALAHGIDVVRSGRPFMLDVLIIEEHQSGSIEKG